jgi:arginyl-tRNA synthetase
MTFKILLDEIQTNLKKIFSDLNFPAVNYVVEPSKPNFGDVTCNAPFLLAKLLKKKPFEIAKTISEKYEILPDGLIKKAEAHPSGNLNFFTNPTEFNKIVLQASLDENYGYIDLGNRSKILVEHTSVNPNKALHIGHVRNVTLGDTIVRVLSKANYDVSALNYVDDSGLQVADIVVGFKYADFPEAPSNGQKFDEYCGDVVYVKTTEMYSSNKALEEKRNTVLKEIEDETSDTAKFAEIVTKKVLAEQLKTCWRLGATYDCLNFESQIIRSGLWNKIFEKIKEMKLIELEKEGKNANCWVIRGKNKDDDKVLVRSNGTATYIAKDIPYAAWKLGLVDDPFNYKKYSTQENGKILWQTTLDETSETKMKFSGDKVITVIDSRQSRLQKIITDLISKFKSDHKSYLHLAYESVTLSAQTAKILGIDTMGKQTQMSGRKGVYVNADHVLNLLEQKISEETKKRNSDLDEKSINNISKDVAIGTIRYEMIKQDMDKIITFDLTKSLSLEGDTASYLQYTHARASRILEKAGFPPNYEISFELLENEYEIKLIKQIGKFDLQVKDAAVNFSPKVIAKYCYDLSVDFNSFYEHAKVLDLENKSLTNSRLCLVSSFQSTLAKALDLLGIAAPNRM